jgi:hypothetical protein
MVQKCPDNKLKIDDKINTLLLLDDTGKVIKKEFIAEMTPGCRFCGGLYFHRVN